MKPNNLLMLVVAAAALAACRGAQTTPTTALAVTDTAVSLSPNPTETTSAEVQMDARTYLGLVNNAPDGNRFVTGQGSFPDMTALDISLDGTPLWVVGTPYQDGSLWAVALEDGTVQAFTVLDGQAAAFELTPAQLPAGMPPALRVSEEMVGLLSAPLDAIAPLTSPAWIAESNILAYLTQGNDLNVGGTVLPIDALPDARLLTDADGNILLLSSPSQHYDHGILGDTVEAGSITMVATQPEPHVVRTIPIPEEKVVEGIAPIWADITGDGEKEIIVTLSDYGQGAQLAVVSEAGELLAQSDPIGQSYRWRNQMAVGPFGPKGEIELVDVLTPHINGVVEFFQLQGERLEIVASVPGYTSHVIYTRNPDMGVAGDFNGDGRPEIALPNQQLDAIVAIQRSADGAAVAWQLPLDGELSTNLAAVPLESDGLLLAAGRSDGVLRLWLP
jgi:hypothetical protein